ncbi:MAG: YdcF family protein [Opitutaceae bacterium]|nr:YdcF family protein [Opitutaceae bacterium]
MLFLNKLLPVMALPIGIVFVLLLLALLLRRKWPAFLAALWLYAVSMPAVGDWLIGRLETQYPLLEPAKLAPADAVLVLGGVMGPVRGPQYFPEWADPVDRFEAGVRLMQLGKAGKLLFTGGRIPWENRPETEGAAMQRECLARGIPPEAIGITGEVGNTADEARAVSDYCRVHGLRKIILVTSAWHMPRAAWLFRHAGVEVTPFPVDYRCDPTRPFTLLDFLPKADALLNSETAMRESYGLLFYQLFH